MRVIRGKVLEAAAEISESKEMSQRKPYLEEFFLEIFADRYTNIYKFSFRHICN